MPPASVKTSFRIPLNAAARKEKVELLAPAGSFEALVAAVENGADAVYVGGQKMNARKFATNFTDEELARACEYAHVRGVKVFLTLNTLVSDAEMPEAVAAVAHAHDIGIDAIIVQDLGIMQAARALAPALPVHISTQATVHNSAGIRFLEDLGAERVILARENSTKEMRDMRAKTDAELESFVHGAMCYCYSGQCLMSSLIGGRSGNRGACAYTCRLDFTMEAATADGKSPPPRATRHDHDVYRPLTDVQAKHVLSSKDLNNLDEIAELIDAGATSFKIEGRMKRPEYVAIVTRAYREAIDSYYAGKFYVSDATKERVLKVFNREFTPGWVHGKEKWSFTSWDTSGNRGTPLGEVVASGANWVTVRLADTLRANDGIEILGTGPEPEEYGFAVRDMRVQGRPTAEARAGEVVELRGHQSSQPGDLVYKTADHETLSFARSTYERPQRKVPVDVEAWIAVGEPVKIRMRDAERGFEIVHVSTHVPQPARKAPVTEAAVRDQVAKLGETPFRPAHVSAHVARDAFVPVSVLNDARRAAAAELESAIAAHYRRAPTGRAFAAPQRLGTPKGGAMTLAVNCWTLDNLRAALEAGAGEVYFSALKVGGLQPKYDDEALATAVTLAREHGAKLWLASGMIQKDYEIALLEKALDAHPDLGVLAGNHGAFHVARAKGRAVVGDWMLNVYNSATVDYLNAHGAERLTLSPELTLAGIDDLAHRTPQRVEVLAHGRLTLMTSEYCSIGHATACQMPGGTWAPCHDHKYRLHDRTGAEFPLETDGACRMYILNSVELNMVNKLDALARAGVDVVRIESIGTRPDALAEQVRVYGEALASRAKGGAYDDTWWARLAAIGPDGFTSGHFFRGPE